jgi:hypothetical protein
LHGQLAKPAGGPDNRSMSIQVLIVGIHLARSTRGKPCAPPTVS